jgi:predicted PurR-regulated permease PerM
MDLPTALVALIAVAVIAYIVTVVHAATTQTLGRPGEAYDPAQRLFAWPKWLAGLIGVLLVIWLIYSVRGILLPFVLGGVVAYLLNPGVARLERRGWARERAILLVFGVFVAVLALGLVLIVPQLTVDTDELLKQYDKFASDAWEVVAQAQETVVVWGRLVGMLPEDVQNAFTVFRERAQQYFYEVLRNSLGLLNRSLVLVSLLVITPVVAFWVLRDYQSVGRRMLQALPEPRRTATTEVLSDINKLVGSYLLGMVTMMVIVGAFAVIVLTIAGVRFSALLGILTGVLYVIPYIGFPAAMVVIVLTMAVTKMGIGSILVVLGVMVAGNVVFDFGVQPRVIGGRVGIHPLVVIFAVLAGATLFGFIGIVIAVPIAGAIKVVLMHFWPELFAPEPSPQLADAESS